MSGGQVALYIYLYIVSAIIWRGLGVGVGSPPLVKPANQPLHFFFPRVYALYG